MGSRSVSFDGICLAFEPLILSGIFQIELKFSYYSDSVSKKSNQKRNERNDSIEWKTMVKIIIITAHSDSIR